MVELQSKQLNLSFDTTESTTSRDYSFEPDPDFLNELISTPPAKREFEIENNLSQQSSKILEIKSVFPGVSLFY